MKVSLLATAAALAAVVAGCGKKGPPLPPLIKLPSAPAELTAERRGDTVDFQFNVPNTNTDNSHPANIERVDVYALNGAASLKDAEFLKLATRVASVPVKAPRNPDETADPDDPDTVVDAPEGNGLDQGAAAHLSEQLTADSLKSVDASKTSGKQTARARQDDGARPLLGPPSPLPSRTYVAVGQSTRGKKGALSRRVAVPLIQPPVAPGAPTFKYDETSVTVRWSPINPPATVQSATSGDVLPSTPIGVALPSIAYHVYDSSPASETAVPAASDGQTTSGATSASSRDAASANGTNASPTRLTRTPVDGTEFVDSRIAWGQDRCYSVRSVETIAGLSIESAPGPSVCQVLTDTFPPAAPKGLRAVPSEGAINLIWDASGERDLAGYIVLRSETPGAPLQPLMLEPIQETAYRDTVNPGSRFTYAVKAVDKVGNVSDASAPVEESAR